MSNKSSYQEINRGISWRQFLESYSYIDDICRIIDLVQKHPDFFNVRVGGSTIKAAADYLEKVVQDEQ